MRPWFYFPSSHIFKDFTCTVHITSPCVVIHHQTILFPRRINDNRFHPKKKKRSNQLIWKCSNLGFSLFMYKIQQKVNVRCLKACLHSCSWTDHCWCKFEWMNSNTHDQSNTIEILTLSVWCCTVILHCPVDTSQILICLSRIWNKITPRCKWVNSFKWND